MSWTAFSILELISSPKYSHKRLGCLLGSLILPHNLDLAILGTSQIKKTFVAKNPYEICSAISLASAICTREIGNCLEDDLARLLTHSKSCVRRKGCLLARRILLSSPESGERIAKLLVEKLKDDDTGVLIAAAASLLDCANVRPLLLVEAIPSLYKLLDNKNNWLVIKAIQGLCALLKAEKRLYTKLGERLLSLLDVTKALSTEMEIYKQIVKHFPTVPELIAKVKGKVGNYVENSDANVKYNGLIILKQLLPLNKDLLIIYKDKLVKMFVSGDGAIKTRTLEILGENVLSPYPLVHQVHLPGNRRGAPAPARKRLPHPETRNNRDSVEHYSGE